MSRGLTGRASQSYKWLLQVESCGCKLTVAGYTVHGAAASFNCLVTKLLLQKPKKLATKSSIKLLNTPSPPLPPLPFFSPPPPPPPPPPPFFFFLIESSSFFLVFGFVCLFFCLIFCCCCCCFGRDNICVYRLRVNIPCTMLTQ